MTPRTVVLKIHFWLGVSVMQLNDRSTVLVSQYDAHVLGRITCWSSSV
jgi:hypothetical protein